MKEAYTNPVVIKAGASSDLCDWIIDKYDAENTALICDENTLPIAENHLPVCPPAVIFKNGCEPTDINTEQIIKTCSGKKILIACGAGTIHDLTRHAAHNMGIPFVSYPTAASVDGFISGIAAITVNGRKVTFPSTPPAALFADTDVYSAAPAKLTSAGVGDIVGKYISLFDWRASCEITGEKLDEEMYTLQWQSVEEIMLCEPSSPDYHERLMRALVTSGLVIQYMGSSRAASGAEHHLSHLWEMHVINKPTPALHGEKVGVATLLVLEYYKKLKQIQYIPDPNRFDRKTIEAAFGAIAEGIICENTPSSLLSVSPEAVAQKNERLLEMISELPCAEWMTAFLIKHGCLTKLSEIGLPDTEDFIEQTLTLAPYVRNRLTLLKLRGCGNVRLYN